MRLARRILVLFTAVAATLPMAASASAATPNHSRPAATPNHSQQVRIQIQMTVTGVNAAVAKAAGYQIATRPDGTHYAVKAGSSGASGASARPDASVPLVCGWGTIEYDNNGNKKGTIYSGWDLTNGEVGVDFDWNIADHDSAGVGSKDFYDMPDGPSASWSIPTGWVTTHSVTGTATAVVTDGVIIEGNGDICSETPDTLTASVDIT
jgi:hypothetical protein